MAAISKIVFPSPPPTTNTLTSLKRAQLIRSTKKIERVLGIAPQIIDIYSFASSSTDSSDEDDLYRFKSRGSVESISSCSTSANSTPHARSIRSRHSRRRKSRTLSPASRSSHTSHTSHTSRSSLSTSSSYHSVDTLLDSDAAKPLLRLAMTSPSFDDASDYHSINSESDSDEVGGGDLRYTIRPPPPSVSIRESSFLAPPAFSIPSSNSLRLAKMDRIRRKLGDDVPIHLVFPAEEDEDEDEQVDSLIPVSANTPNPPLAPIISRRPLPPLPIEETSSVKTSSPTKLCNARDSLLLVHSSSRQVHKIKRKPVPKYDADEAKREEEQEQERLRSFSLEIERRTAKERLSLILELPREYEFEDELSEEDDDDDILATPRCDYGPSPISAWFSDGGEDDPSGRDCYQNFLNYESTVAAFD